MTIKATTHINFRGDARAALAFYHSVFGGDQALVTYADAHAVTDPAEADQIMWGQVASADGFQIMAFDVPSARGWNPGLIPFFVSLRCDEEAVLKQRWEKLCDGGAVLHPLGPAGFSPLYGMVKDAFGVTWVVDLQVAHPAA